MAKTRAEVLSTLRALGLTTDEANAELQAREAEAQKLVASASPAARDNALLLARLLVRSEVPYYVRRSFDAQPAPELDEVSPAPGGGREAPRKVLRAVRSRYQALVTGPKWRLAIAIAGPVAFLSIVVLAAVGGLNSLGISSGTANRHETLAARVDSLIATPVPAPPPPHIAQAPQYQVLYTLTKKRLDGGKTLYVLIDPVDLSTPYFKDDLKQLVRDIVGQYGASISIEIHDDPNSLQASYARFGDKSARLPLTAAEGTNEALHFVAAFNGNLDTGMYLNTLQFFSAANSDTPVVGKYIEDIDFDPR